MAILVTGGAGYIGSHTCLELLNAGQEIIVFDNFSNSSPEALRRVEKLAGKTMKVYEGDLLDKKSVTQVFEENQIEAVIHFAGLKAVGESVSVPLRYYQHNVAGTLTLCEVMQRFGVKKLVFSSSATVYGNPNKVPITEEMSIGATNPYGRTKLIIEEILRDIAFADPSWSIAILRYFNPIGAHESGKIGEDPNGIPNNLMPYIAQIAVGKLEKLKIFGNSYETKDGTGIRDYIHVVDLASGHLQALGKIKSTVGADTFNLGTGKGYSVLEVITAFENASGRRIPFEYTAPRSGDVAVCYANPEKARKLLNWEATRGIEQMCRDTWNWQFQHPQGYETEKSKLKSSPRLHAAGGLFIQKKAPVGSD